MPRLRHRTSRFFLPAFVVLFFFAGRPSEFGKDNVFFQGYLIQKPVIRIALGVNLEDVHVHASSGMKVYQVSGNYKLLAEDISEARVKGHKEKLSEKFIVQAAQSKRREDAEKIAKILKPKLDRRVSVAQDKENDLDGIYQVRVGDFLTRGIALDCIKELNRLGYKDAWIIRDEVTIPASKPQWVMVNNELINLDQATSLYFIPATPQSYLTYGGKNYRGLFVLRGSRSGTLLINILNVEDYLKGVVPGELSPLFFPEIEALKAQAIAARTYALKNTGQFEESGFDLYATPASQVYDGLSIEHPMSTRAVEETRGQVAVYGGKLITALYTSTCGGATEDVENIFAGASLPYLKSTECVQENGQDWPLRTDAVLPPLQIEGRIISPRLAYLMALDIIPAAAHSSSFKDASSLEETADWIRRSLGKLGKRNDVFSPKPFPMTFEAFACLVIEAFQWQDRVQNLVAKSEEEEATKDVPGLKPEARGPLAYFLLTGIYPPSLDVGDKTRIMSRGEAAFYLAKVVSTYKDFTRQGYVRNLARGKIEIVEGDETKVFDLAPDLWLLRGADDAVAVVPSFDLTGGDVVKWVENGGRIRLLQDVSTQPTHVLDRNSQFNRWQIRISREDLESRLNQYYPVGPLVDVIPQKRGKSKRVIEASIIGRESQVRVTGLKVRQVLNLRDNLFVVDREKDEEGRVTQFIFSGRGWGHGVGLCQIGAYRMAQKGSGYEEILKKYYRGIALDKIY